MFINYKKLIFTILFIFGFAAIFFVLNNEKNTKVEKYKEENFNLLIKKSQSYLKALIKEKQNATLAIAISIAKDSDLIRAIENDNLNSSQLKAISLSLRENTNFKNVWFQVIDKNGFSLQRSWTDKKGDQISQKRLDLQQLLEKPKVTTTISVGKFDMTFKSIVPVYNKQNDFLGFFEVITHFNSISRKLFAETGVFSIILADKRYKKQLTLPFTKRFAGDYYVANLDADPDLLRYIKYYGVTKLISHFFTNNYIISDDINSLISYYSYLGTDSKPMGHFLLFHKISDIDMTKINDIKNIYNLYLLIALIFFSLVLYLLYNAENTEDTKYYKLKISLSLLLVFSILTASIYVLLKDRFTSNIEYYKEELKTNTLLEYRSIYDRNKDLADTIFSTIINNDRSLRLFENRQRDELRDYLLEKYEYLKERFSIRQVHFHLKDSSSFLRMHKPSKYGDSLKGIRESVEHVNTQLKPFDGFEEGRIVNGFRFVYPVFNKEKKHLGSVEISFNAKSFIDKYLELFKKKKVNILISKSVIDNKVFESERSNYKKSPMNNFYFDKQLLASLDQKNFLTSINTRSKEQFKDLEQAILKGEPFVRHFPASNDIAVFIPLVNKISGELVGCINIVTDDGYIKKTDDSFYLFFFIALVTIMFILIFIYRELLSKQNIKEQRNIIQHILDSQSSFILLTNGKKLIKTNHSLLNFFQEKSVEDFARKHECICKFFEENEDDQYIQTYMDGKFWIDYIRENKDKQILVKIKKPLDGSIHIFKIELQIYSAKNDLFILTFIDITNLKKMEKQMVQSEKMASLAEMIENIAHQWRQPLSVISTAASGLVIQKEYGTLTDKEFIKTCTSIDESAQYLSKTIDEFRNFIKGEEKTSTFKINKHIEEFLQMIDTSLKQNKIKIIKELGEESDIYGYPNQLTQCFNNIFNNAKDAVSNNDPDQRYIHISQTKDEEKITVKFTDNGGGIDEKIIGKVFEPYFTTKHKAQGTGLGLNATFNFIVNTMKGDISVSNKKVLFENKEYDGVCVTLTLPLDFKKLTSKG